MAAIGDQFKHKALWDSETDDFCVCEITEVGPEHVIFATPAGVESRLPLNADPDTTWTGFDAEVVHEWVVGPN
jgi:hypothetical protein